MTQDPTNLRDVAQAHVLELELPPEGAELVVTTTPAPETLVLTGVEAAIYGRLAGEVNTPGEPAVVTATDVGALAEALEALGRLRGRRLEELARPDVAVADLRAKLLRALDVGADDLEQDVDLDDHKRAVGRVSASARALEALGPAPVLMPASPAPTLIDDVSTRRLAGHVYQAVQGAGHQAEAAETAREAVLAGVLELNSEERHAGGDGTFRHPTRGGAL